MLSYRHAFHAGNFADVLKHLVLIQILEHLKQKEKAFCYIDTHAGAGCYDLQGSYAQQNREFDNGIGKLWHLPDVPAPVAAYVDLIRRFNQGGALRRYPGSPAIAQHLLRPQDRLDCFELHTTETLELVRQLSRDRRATAHYDDGLKASIALLPPVQRRAVVLLDPSYELKADYERVVESLVQMHKRFATGIYALWYPVIDRSRIHQLERSLTASGIKDIQSYELSITENPHSSGMTACGLIVINPPWTLKAAIQDCLPWLSQVLAEPGDRGRFEIKILAKE